MPTYSYRDIVTGNEYELTMSISEMVTFEEENKGVMSRVLKPVAFGDPVRLGVHKQPASWNDLTKTIKQRNRHSNLNTGNGEL